MTSPYKLATDSPSRQLLWELSQLAISSQQRFYEHLDQENEKREAEHKRALKEAAAEHDRVRRSAEQFRERLELQIQAERQRKEEEAQKEIERQRRENLAREDAAKTREIERAKTAELEAQRAEEARKAEAAAVEKRKREKEQRDTEIARRLKDEQDKRNLQKQQAATAATAQVQAQKAPVITQDEKSAFPTQPAPALNQNAAAPTKNEHDAEHARYLEIHKKLKEVRKFMSNQAGQNPNLKGSMGEMRRGITKSVGQIREGKGRDSEGRPYSANQRQAITDILKKITSIPGPTIDITMFLASPPAQLSNTNCPALLVYLLNIFSKAIIAQLIDEASVKPQMADNLGVVALQIFASDAFRWQGISLIDILISKLHRTCPVLFGIYGDEKSATGKDRLGWWREEPNGPFIPQQQHFARLTGLGAGFAAISLRNFEKAAAINPYPDFHYWKALARISNVPTNQITQTHFVVLKAMIQGYEDKFLMFYGDAGRAALRNALIELPRRSPQSVASKALAGLVDVQKREQKLYLEDGPPGFPNQKDGFFGRN